MESDAGFWPPTVCEFGNEIAKKNKKPPPAGTEWLQFDSMARLPGTPYLAELRLHSQTHHMFTASFTRYRHKALPHVPSELHAPAAHRIAHKSPHDVRKTTAREKNRFWARGCLFIPSAGAPGSMLGALGGPICLFESEIDWPV